MTRRLIAGATTLTIGRVTSQALALVRHVIIGRMLSPGDLGVAAVLMLTSALLEVTTQLSVDKLLIQSRDGNDPAMQRTSQMFLAVRGAIAAGCMLVLAVPASHVFGVPQAESAFALFSIVLLVNGFVHLDCRRYHRRGRFGADMIVEVGSQAIATAAAWPLIDLIGGYDAVVVLLIARAAVLVAWSHVVAERPYRWSWDRAYVGRIVGFGWPLLASAVVIFLIQQGDQLIVGAGYSMHELGLYAVASTLAVAVSTMLSSIGGTLLLPVLASVQDDHPTFQRVFAIGVFAHAIAGACVSAAMIIAGPALITFLYGHAYEGSGTLIGWLSALQCVRMLRVTPAIAAMARGDTVSSLITNLWRVSVLPGAVLVVALGLSPIWIAVVGVGGEVLALGAISSRLIHRHAIHVDPVAWTGAACAIVLTTAGITAMMLGPINGVIAVLITATLALGAGVILALEHRLGNPNTSRFSLAKAAVQEWTSARIKEPIA